MVAARIIKSISNILHIHIIGDKCNLFTIYLSLHTHTHTIYLSTYLSFILAIALKALASRSSSGRRHRRAVDQWVELEN